MPCSSCSGGCCSTPFVPADGRKSCSVRNRQATIKQAAILCGRTATFRPDGIATARASVARARDGAVRNTKVEKSRNGCSTLYVVHNLHKDPMRMPYPTRSGLSVRPVWGLKQEKGMLFNGGGNLSTSDQFPPPFFVGVARWWETSGTISICSRFFMIVQFERVGY